MIMDDYTLVRRWWRDVDGWPPGKLAGEIRCFESMRTARVAA